MGGLMPNSQNQTRFCFSSRLCVFAREVAFGSGLSGLGLYAGHSLIDFFVTATTDHPDLRDAGFFDISVKPAHALPHHFAVGEADAAIVATGVRHTP